MDRSKEDELLIALKDVLARAADAILLLNATCVHLAAAVEQLERRLSVMPVMS
jgi:hypothetical protein